ncbi:MAG: hypothetical protein M3336_03115 [Chloroflexota bacterium]|nr:hypothetical protein [Chloroflexota bacterium]
MSTEGPAVDEMWSPEYNEWYYGFDCVNCGTFIPWLHDPRQGASGLTFQGEGPFALTCYACSHHALYAPEQVLLRLRTR